MHSIPTSDLNPTEERASLRGFGEVFARSAVTAYALITPARNEERFIEATVRSVIAQTTTPRRWMIVSDGSTDRTDAIVKYYASRFSYIRLLRIDHREQRSFASKVAAFNAGYTALGGEEYEFIGNLDADVTFDPPYFAQLLEKFVATPTLGLAGGMIHELIGNRLISQDISLNSVAGAVQLFRRRCFEEVGGYLPLPSGGIDTVAEILARMRGWDVRTFPELIVHTGRRARIGSSNICAARFRHGLNSYRFGYHPLFHMLSSFYRTGQRPFLVGGLSSLAGYIWAFLHGEEVVLPTDAVSFLRTEQLERIHATLVGRRLPTRSGRSAAIETTRRASDELTRL